jgi:quercetin 2,3-dioxygenase
MNIDIVPVAQLAHVDRGWTRGDAHIAFDDVPPGAPGFLDLAPVMLAVLERIDPHKGYATHPHKNLLSVTVPLSGTFHHEDSNGDGGAYDNDCVCVLHAGTGIEHSEFAGPEGARAVMFWLRPVTPGGEPKMVIDRAPRTLRRNRLVKLAAPRADAAVWSAVLDPGVTVTHDATGVVYLLATDGAIEVNGRRAELGERVIVRGAGPISLRAIDATEVVVLDLA